MHIQAKNILRLPLLHKWLHITNIVLHLGFFFFHLNYSMKTFLYKKAQ